MSRATTRVTCDLRSSVQLAGSVAITLTHARRASSASFGSAHGTAAAGTALTMTIKPSAKVLRQIRAAAKRKGKIALSFTLMAINAAAQTTAKAGISKLTVS